MENKTNLTGASFGVLGDSYSTFKDHIPEGNRCYYPNTEKVDDVLTVEQTWWHQLMTRNDMQLVINDSYSGATVCTDHSLPEISAYTERAKRSFSGETQPDYIFIFGGTNDYGHGDAPFGSWGDRTNDTFIGACHYLFSEMVKKYPAARIVVLTPLQTSYDQNPSANTGKPLIDYVDAIIKVAAHYSLPVLDLYRTAGICPRIPEHIPLFMPDGLHPNDAGAARIAERLAAFLQSL